MIIKINTRHMADDI